MTSPLRCTRRHFLATTAAGIAGAVSWTASAAEAAPEPVIDIHQHTEYTSRSDKHLIAHQLALGVTLTVLLPAGRPVKRPSTHDGKSNGLAAQCGGNDTVVALSRAHPQAFRFFTNEVADLPEAPGVIEKFLKLGALGIGEQKFGVDCDSPSIERIAEVAQSHGVPVLLHFQHGMYNLGLERFATVLKKFPKVNFIGHAQTWWANIDLKAEQPVLYPTAPVTRGGLTDRLLTDYPNMFGDLSAGSGLNALVRDEEHTRGFLERHQDKLLFGSDCNDLFGRGPGCQGAQILAAIRRFAPDKKVKRKILHDNAHKLLRLGGKPREV